MEVKVIAVDIAEDELWVRLRSVRVTFVICYMVGQAVLLWST